MANQTDATPHIKTKVPKKASEDSTNITASKLDEGGLFLRKGVNWISIGAVNLALGVGLGAFGSHGLKRFASDYAISIWQTATLYLMIHALGIVLVGIIHQFGNKPLHKTALTLQMGIVLFSGSLYAMAFGLPKWLGAITPIGGMLFIIGWLSLAVSARHIHKA